MIPFLLGQSSAPAGKRARARCTPGAYGRAGNPRSTGSMFERRVRLAAAGKKPLPKEPKPFRRTMRRPWRWHPAFAGMTGKAFRRHQRQERRRLREAA